ncbi:AraC family transcriptional regulator [Chania multitudinisentens RB-25]|uniref:AraC family transcriptional regulator n=2 Tax=Chania TaxID=1745211 RepID=W0L9V4_9GAMM|nr:AraC family transcriptional regulator [Chania multitudinisentens RB-25]
MPGVEAVLASTRHAYPKHFHTQFGIGLIEHGAQKSLSGRGQVEAGPGDVITVNPGEVHDGRPIGEQPRSWRMLYLEPAVVIATIGELAAGNAHHSEFSSPALVDAIAAASFRSLFKSITCASHHNLQQEQALLLLLARLLHVSEPKETAPAPRLAKERIDDDPASPVTLAELAQLCGMSRFQLLRSFQRATGITPHAYQIQRRIQVARQLIAAGTPLAESAAAAGFADQSHLSRQFRQALGVSPGIYANNQRRS